MSECQKCGSNRIFKLSAKHRDCLFIKGPDGIVQEDGYNRLDEPFGDDSDYLSFEVCFECGQVQGTFPIVNPSNDMFDEDEEE